MSDYIDCGYYKKTKSGKNYFVKVGSAKMKDDGGFTVFLDAYPIPVDGTLSITTRLPRERGEQHNAAPAFDDSLPPF